MARLRARDRPFVPTEDDLLGASRGSSSSGVRSWEEPPGPVDWGGRHARPGLPRRWVRLPGALASARWQPRGAAVLGVVLVCVLVAAILGVRVAWARSAATGTVIAPGGGSRAGPSVSALAGPSGPASPDAGATAPGQGVAPATAEPGASAPGAAPSVSAAAGAGTDVVVHVVGQVRSPGVLSLPGGSRVSDAVEAAGGATSTADLGSINLARALVDGEQVRVPKPGEEVVQAPAPPTGGAGAGGAGTGPGPAGGVVSLNTADLLALDTLPGVGPVLAQRILDWRAEHGRFTTVDELSEVSGIGEKLLAGIRPLVSV